MPTCSSHSEPLVGCAVCFELLHQHALSAERRLETRTQECHHAVMLIGALAKMAGISDVTSNIIVDFLESRYP